MERNGTRGKWKCILACGGGHWFLRPHNSVLRERSRETEFTTRGAIILSQIYLIAGTCIFFALVAVNAPIFCREQSRAFKHREIFCKLFRCALCSGSRRLYQFKPRCFVPFTSLESQCVLWVIRWYHDMTPSLFSTSCVKNTLISLTYVEFQLKIRCLSRKNSCYGLFDEMVKAIIICAGLDNEW